MDILEVIEPGDIVGAVEGEIDIVLAAPTGAQIWIVLMWTKAFSIIETNQQNVIAIGPKNAWMQVCTPCQFCFMP
jgi:hypothetical protein